MRKPILGALLTSIFVLGNVAIRGQEFSLKQNVCQPSAEEVLSLIQAAYNLSPSPEGVLIAGEVQAPNQLRVTEKPLTLTRALAMSGGAVKTAKEIYLIRRSAKDERVVEIDSRDIREGRAKDLLLENGDVVFVSRGCADGKLLPPRKTTYPYFHNGTDNPSKAPNNSKTK